MAVETSLSKLQKQVNKLEKDNDRLRELLNNQKEKNRVLNKKIKNLEKLMEEKVAKAVAEFATDLIKENEKLKEENERMRRILNHDSNNTGIPTSKTPIGKEKRIPNSREKSELLKGGQVGHTKSTLKRFKDEEITHTYIHELKNKKCPCGGKFKIIETRRKDEFEIQIRLMKIAHEFGVYACDCCGQKIEIPIPNN